MIVGDSRTYLGASMDRSLESVVTVITGAGRGIGAATARLFAQHGAKVVCAARSQTELEGVVSEIVGKGGEAIAVVADLTEPEQVSELFRQAEERFGPAEILINNAGACIPRRLVDMSLEVYRRTIDTNLTATFLCCQAVLPKMIERERGQIVNISSVSGIHGVPKFPGFTAYAAAKAGVAALSEALAAEVREHGIRVNAVSPGSVDTLMLREAAPSVVAAMQPEEVAEILLFLSSSPARPINGTNIEIFG